MDTATRRGGVFLTPLPFAKKACDYIEKIIGNSWHDYRLWDMAAGTGHLELFLPRQFLKNCYLSTLTQKDVEHLKKEFPDATVFQYNYLNDDVEQHIPPPVLERVRTRGKTGKSASSPHSNHPPEVGAAFRQSKIPDALQNDLANPKIKWIILVNPPYATAQEAGLKGTSKEGVSDTKIRKRMHAEGLGEVSRELYVQFLYRIMNEFKPRETLLGLFAPLKYLISANYQKFRDNVFHATFESGFVFSSENFGGTSKTSHFPVAFILWDIFHKKNIAIQEMQLNVLDSTAKKIGIKTVKPVHRNEFLSRWIKRPRGTKIFPPFSSALVVKSDNVDTRNRIAEGFLASLMCPGNELQNRQQTAFLSGPQASAGALSVTLDNFEQAVVVFAARRIPKDSWVNHVDQLLRPTRELSPEFVSDCAVWSLFDSKNQTVSLRDVAYQGQVYQIVNHFFPFSRSELLSLDCTVLRNQNSFVADWLEKQTLSSESQNVLSCAKEIYRLYFAHLHEPDDAGWYQICKALREAKLGVNLFTELKHLHDSLRTKILPLLYDYGIVTSEPQPDCVNKPVPECQY
jgi:hypothetical protein